MRTELTVKTRSLSGSSDLTLLAPIRVGLVPSLEAVTYKTRVKRLLKTLNAGRASAHEYAWLRPFSDAVERVGRIHSVRVAVLEPQDQVLLAATFDGAWESYIRVLWQKVGALLDVIFCNTVDYVSAFDHGYEEWLAWAQRVQVETAFFYGTPAFTVDDERYSKDQEALLRRTPAGPASDLEATRQTVPSVESAAWNVTAQGHIKTYPETGKLGLQSLAALYRLTDVYLPSSEDGKYLLRAARELLLEFVHLKETTDLLVLPLLEAGDRFDRQLAWLGSDPDGVKRKRLPPPALPPDAPPPYDAGNVQAGILKTHEGVTHGCLLLAAFDGPAAAAMFLDRVIPRVSRDDDPPAKGKLLCNLAFTHEGLRAAGVPESVLALFPQEFREGMEARAGVLGDLYLNHPRRWRLPVRRGQPADAAQPERIDLATVHAVVQLRIGAPPGAASDVDDPDARAHPLHADVRYLFPKGAGTRLLAIQPLRRHTNDAGDVTEHFGFADGNSVPTIDPKPPGKIYRNQVHLGELLLGHDNEADPAPGALDPPPDIPGGGAPLAAIDRAAWLRDGTFLVVRKYSQDVEALKQAVQDVVDADAKAVQDIADAARDAAGADVEGPEPLDHATVLAKMMGRRQDGTPLMPHQGLNDFDFEFDRTGGICPFHAHIRRANPRFPEQPGDPPDPPGRRTPRLMRRSMSYGPRYVTDAGSRAGRAVNARERGLVFMAYNASIGEQFEVVQRWLSGGNSTGAFSGQGDPFLGVARSGETRHFRFEHEGRVVRMALDGWDALLDEPRPITRLEWGLYLFTPSIEALERLRKTAHGAAPAVAWSAAEGLRRIAALERLEREQGAQEALLGWKSVLEDAEAQEKFVSASVWAAIREHRNGALRTPYGVLVADRDLAMRVLQDDERRYSARGYLPRMAESIGEIYLGLDDTGPGGAYARQSEAANAAIRALKGNDAFELARRFAAGKIKQLAERARRQAKDREDERWELTLDAREVIDEALGMLCEAWWLGAQEDNRRLRRGGLHWDWKAGEPPFYPGNFTAPSRYIFQPQPGKEVRDYARDYGSCLRTALRDWIDDHLAAGTRPVDPHAEEPAAGATPPAGSGAEAPKPPAPVGAAILDALGNAADAEAVDWAARVFVGTMMGFLPTADGNLRLTLNEWLRDGTFWSLRAAMPGPFAGYQAARDMLSRPLCQAMQLRPSPELVWRTATRRHSLGRTADGVAWVEPGDTVVVSIVSASQQCLAEGRPDVSAVFGGDRSARPRHPTHACPAYDAAMGVLTGVLAALLEAGLPAARRASPEGRATLRAGVLPLSLVLQGQCSDGPRVARARAARVPELRRRGQAAWQPASPPAPASRRASRARQDSVPAPALLLAWGDSWLHYRSLASGAPSNVAAFLASRGHAFAMPPLGNNGLMLQTMAREENRKRFADALTRTLLAQQQLRAIVLSGGGNDVVRDRLAALLRLAGSGGDPLIEEKVHDLVDGELRGHYRAILGSVQDVCDRHNGRQRVPVLLHAYDHPVPDGRFFFGRPANELSWLHPYIAPLGYDLEQGKEIMRRLIDRLRAMQQSLRDEFANVVVVPRPGLPDGGDHRRYWENELHPTPEGFARVGQAFADALAALPAPQKQYAAATAAAPAP